MHSDHLVFPLSLPLTLTPILSRHPHLPYLTVPHLPYLTILTLPSSLHLSSTTTVHSHPLQFPPLASTDHSSSPSLRLPLPHFPSTPPPHSPLSSRRPSPHLTTILLLHFLPSSSIIGLPSCPSCWPTCPSRFSSVSCRPPKLPPLLYCFLLAGVLCYFSFSSRSSVFFLLLLFFYSSSPFFLLLFFVILFSRLF